AEFRVDMGEDVLVEGGRDARRIVVGGQQAADVLLEVDPDQQQPVRPDGLGDPFQERGRVGGFEIADGGAGEEGDPTVRPAARPGQRDPAAEVGADRQNLQGGVGGIDGGGGVGELFGGDVD